MLNPAPNHVPLLDDEVFEVKYLIADGLTALNSCADVLGVRVVDMAVGVRRINEDRAHYKALSEAQDTTFTTT